MIHLCACTGKVVATIILFVSTLRRGVFTYWTIPVATPCSTGCVCPWCVQDSACVARGLHASDPQDATVPSSVAFVLLEDDNLSRVAPLAKMFIIIMSRISDP